MSVTKKIKVALCTDGVYPQMVGGMQRHSRLLAEHLSRRKEVELTVIHPHVQGIFEETLGINEVIVPPIDEDRTYLLELKRYSRHVADRLDELVPDVVLSQGFSVWVDLNKWGARTIVHPHGLEMFQTMARKEKLLGYPFRKALRGILRKSNSVISLGGKLTHILSDQVKGAPCQVVTIPNAVDIPVAPSVFPAEEKPMRLFFIGRFAFNKGIDLLLQVAERLVKEGYVNAIHFDLAGDGPLMSDIKKKGVPANVTLHGKVDDAQLDRLYGMCHGLVLPTRFEGMPTVVLEAMAHKRPIIVSDVGATAEQVDTHNGYLLPSGDVESLYNAIMNMRERGSATWKKMGEHSFDRVVERFSWPAVTEQFIQLFKQLDHEV